MNETKRPAVAGPVEPTVRPHAPVFEVGFGWLDDAAKYGRGTKLYARPCTCNPDDNPPKPCAQQVALTDCRTADATRWRETGEEDPHNGQQVLAAIHPYNNPDNGWLIVHAVYTDGRWICPAEHTSLHAPGHWMPAPALPDGA